MEKTKIIKSDQKVTTRNRLCDSVEVTLRDIIVKDLLTDSEKKTYYDEKKLKQFDLFNIYIDKHEEDPDVRFNFSINDEPAGNTCDGFEMFVLSGNNNETGINPIKIPGSIISSHPDTIVQFEMPIDAKLNAFSYHSDGRSYANYAIYGIEGHHGGESDDSNNAYKQTRIMLSKGKIYMTDVIFDLTENILDGQ